MKIYLLGDLGGYTETTKNILNNIKKKINKEDIYFLLGDNFYPNGVKDISDSQWENIKNINSNPIYSVLGNHDYLGSINAQINADISNWNMENNYYMKTIKSIDFFFIDTSLLQPSYSNLNYSIVKSKLDKSPIIAKKEMLDWLNINLNLSTNPKVIIGHYPIISYGMYGINHDLILDLLPIIRKHKVKYYISGHDHNLQIVDIISKDFSMKQIISGATSYLYPVLSNKSEKVFYKYGYIVIDIDLNTVTIFDTLENVLLVEDFLI